jgi:hypothetical protein
MPSDVQDRLDAIVTYRTMERKLADIRAKNGGKESTEEDELLDLMDPVWYRLSDDQKRVLSQERAAG